MSAVLYLIENPIDHLTLDRIDRDATIVVISPAAARSFSARTFERFVERRSMAVVVADGAVEGSALAAGVNADYFAVSEEATIDFECDEPTLAAGILAGLAWRIGRRSVPLLLLHGGEIDSKTAQEEGVIDALVPDREDPLKWVRSWLAGRSLLALQSAASLIRRSGGDRTERAEFSRLFATGEPQKGLKDFLAKRRSDFSESVRVETI